MMSVSRGPLRILVDFLNSSPLVFGALSFVVALVLMLAIGRPMITWLRNKRWRKQGESWTVREDTPDTHLKKQGTPSMGGIGIIASAVVSTVAVFCSMNVVLLYDASSITSTSPINIIPPNYWLNFVLWALLLPLTFLAHGVLGFADDWSKASGRGGLRARTKLIAQLGLAVGFLWMTYALHSWTLVMSGGMRLLHLPSDSPSALLVLGFLLVFLIGTCNAANLTDGIDGLAAGLTVICGLALLLAYPTSHPSWGFYPYFQLFVAALAGACLGFLNFNKHKAQVFMGDTGSLAIGAALAAAAILLRAVWLLPFVGFIFYVEMLSVTTQVLWFKYTRKKYGEGQRLFRRAPLHHHFELGGWSEWRVVLTFWGVNLVTAIIGLILWHTGILPRFP